MSLYSSTKFVNFRLTRFCVTRLLSSDVHNSEDNIEACGKAKKAEDRAKLMRAKTPIGKLEELPEGSHPFQEKEPLKPFPGGINPKTGESGGPKGPEPTRYGDWERKGRVTDF